MSSRPSAACRALSDEAHAQLLRVAYPEMMVGSRKHRKRCIGQKLSNLLHGPALEGSLSEQLEEIKRVFDVLLVIAESRGPLVFVVGHHGLPRLGNAPAAADVAV